MCKEKGTSNGQDDSNESSQRRNRNIYVYKSEGFWRSLVIIELERLVYQINRNNYLCARVAVLRPSNGIDMKQIRSNNNHLIFVGIIRFERKKVWGRKQVNKIIWGWGLSGEKRSEVGIKVEVHIEMNEYTYI